MRVLAALPLLLLAAPALAAAPPPPGVYTNTTTVEAVAVAGDTVWVATGGGVEAYDARTLAWRRVYTTADGLAANDVRGLNVVAGAPVARTDRASCTIAGDRWTCSAAPALPAPEPRVARSFQGARETQRVATAAGVLVGTAGRGLWLDGAAPRRLTPEGQICSNHVTTVVEHAGAVWFGTFDEGLCRWDGTRFERAAAPFRMVNDLAATPKGLFVAASEGLFVTTDGKTFAEVAGVPEKGMNDLAYADGTLYATSPAAMWRLPLTAAAKKKARLRAFWRPGRTRAIQAVAAAGGAVWLASEDKGALRVGKKAADAEVFDRAAGLPSSWALDVAVAGGDAWVATLRHGLVRIDPAGRVSQVMGLPDPWLLHVSADPDGRSVWVGAQGGLARVGQGGEVTTLHELPHPNVHVAWRKGALLVVGTEGGTQVRTIP